MSIGEEIEVIEIYVGTVMKLDEGSKAVHMRAYFQNWKYSGRCERLVVSSRLKCG